MSKMISFMHHICHRDQDYSSLHQGSREISLRKESTFTVYFPLFLINLLVFICAVRNIQDFGVNNPDTLFGNATVSANLVNKKTFSSSKKFL